MNSHRELLGGCRKKPGGSAPIEQWLGWAFHQELPRAGNGGGSSGGASSVWDRITQSATLGAMIDRTNWYGCVIDYSVDRDPDPDAEKIGEAVLGLGNVFFDAPDAYDLLGDLVLADGTLPSAEEKAEAMALGIGRAGLDVGRIVWVVTHFAMLGKAPPWGRPRSIKRRLVNNAAGGVAWFRKVERCAGEGRPSYSVEVDGFDRVKRRPHRGAYRKSVLVPDLGWLVAERAEYQAYVLALAELAACLDGRLGGAVDPSELPLWPWETSAHHLAPKLTENDDDARQRGSMAA